ncbi:MAG: hypothetical protein S4CHLAM7_09030 [Chlamydiae bacterium]|nr:hypothetical protein [Chlamydiota bacterium]
MSTLAPSRTNMTSNSIDNIISWVKQEFEKDEHLFSLYLKSRQIKTQCISSSLSKTRISLPREIEKVEILLLNYSEITEEKTLIDNLSKAIDKHIAKAACIHIPKSRVNDYFEEIFLASPKVRWVLISEMHLYQLPDLMLQYDKFPSRSLFKKAVFLLSELKAYNADLNLKKSLWKTLLSEL